MNQDDQGSFPASLSPAEPHSLYQQLVRQPHSRQHPHPHPHRDSSEPNLASSTPTLRPNSKTRPRLLPSVSSRRLGGSVGNLLDTEADLGGERRTPPSFAGGMNQTFMHLINALSQEDADDASEEEEEGGSREQELDVGEEEGSSGDDEDDSDSDSDDCPSTSDDPPTVPPPEIATLHSSTTSSTSSDPFLLSTASSEEDSTSPSPSPPRNAHPAATAASSSVRNLSNMDLGVSVSTLNAIHRPIAARRRTTTGESGEYVKEGQYEDQETEQETGAEGTKREGDSLVESANRKEERGAERKRRLAEKLGDIFGIEGGEEVVAEYQCWLFRSVLLQGFMYLTTGHICFYAYLQQKEGTVLRSGSLSARGGRTRRYHRHWFILKDSALSWYPSSTDPYFPDGRVDLHYCTEVESSIKNPNRFKIHTAEKTWYFAADNEISRDEWVKIIKKVVFRCQNEGESVKISIPLETVIDIELSHNLEFAETIRVRVYDAEEGFSIDEYWLSYFSDLEGALAQMTDVLQRFRADNPQQAQQAAAIIDTTSQGPALDGSSSRSYLPSSPKVSPPESPASAGTGTSLGRRIFSLADRTSGSFTDDKSSGTATPTLPRSSSPRRSLSLTKRRNLEFHTYPPNPSSVLPPPRPVHPRPTSGNWFLPSLSTLPTLPTVTVPAWLKGAPRKLLSTATYPANLLIAPTRKILEVVTKSSLATTRGTEIVRTNEGSFSEEAPRDMSYSLLEEPVDAEMLDDALTNEKFRKAFGLTEKEVVVIQFPGYLFRGIPIYGRVYVSSNFFCFKSSALLARTKMILPLSDIIAVSKHRSYRIGYSGVIVVIKGYEEVFLELGSTESRDKVIQNLEQQIDSVRRRISLGEPPAETIDNLEHQELVDLAASQASSLTSHSTSPLSELRTTKLPIMFCSTSSDFVTFRPEKALRFTCLTIGSRGDVQPYIALCKGLMAEGHKCKIASHAEYRQWVEGHGIEFEEIGGDPAKLMELMIAHDFFSIAFMKESLGHFRGWLDDLLETAWKSCQGADVLIESPSAIAGYHIAEALQIPYFRAFTMPWSRTRTYPHALAVPDHKMGGGYNYMTYTMFDQIFWRAMAGQVNRWRRNTLNLGPTSLEQMQQHKIPFLYNFSPVVIPPPLDWRENIHVTGYWWLDNPDDSSASKWQPPASLLVFLDRAKIEGTKVVFIGFGSIIIPDPEEMTRVVYGAVEKAGVYAVVAKGWSDRATSDKSSSGQEGAKEKQAELEVPETAEVEGRPYIYNVKSIPHDWLFPRIHAAVHHGGAGTTGASLRAGLPTIVKPFFGDQHFYADRIATLGIGSALRNMTIDNLAVAITTAVTDEKQIARAKLAGEEIRKEDGVGNAIECIYRDLDYARSIIPRLPSPTGATQNATRPEETPSRRLSLNLRSRRSSTPAVSPRFLPTPSPRGGKKANSSEEWEVLSSGTGKGSRGSESGAGAGGLGGSRGGFSGSDTDDLAEFNI